MADQCVRYGLADMPIGVFESFHFSWLSSIVFSSNDQEFIDPLFPGVGNLSAPDLCKGLREDLRASGIQNDGVLDTMCSDVHRYCKRLSRSLTTLAKKVYSEPQQTRAVQKADLGEKGVAFFYKGVTVRISHEHLSKLTQLHHCCSGSSAEADLNEPFFCLLLRYKSLHGGGFQAALPPCVYEVLRSEFGVELEGFASPLNCRYSTFCSAFPDTDAAFGSLASFLHFRPRTGSFALNPPFVGDLILRTAEHCDALLRSAAAAGRALAFVIVVGASDVARRHASWARLCAGEFRRAAHPLILKVPAAPRPRHRTPAE